MYDELHVVLSLIMLYPPLLIFVAVALLIS